MYVVTVHIKYANEKDLHFSQKALKKQIVDFTDMQMYCMQMSGCLWILLPIISFIITDVFSHYALEQHFLFSVQK